MNKELKKLLEQDEDIYFYKSIWDYIDKDFEREAIYNLGVEFGFNPNEKYFGFLNYDGDIDGFYTETDMIEHIKRLLDMENYFKTEDMIITTKSGNKYNIEIDTAFDDEDMKIMHFEGLIVNDEEEIRFYIKQLIEKGYIKDLDVDKEAKEIESMRKILTETRIEKIERVCEKANDLLSQDKFLTMEEYKKLQKEIDSLEPRTDKEKSMRNLANNYLDLSIQTYGDT